MNGCIFCKIIKGEIPSAKIYEDDAVIAFLDISPINKGHTLVVPKEHYKDLLSIPDELLKKLIMVVKKVSKAVLDGTGTKGFNLGLNNGPISGQLVPHIHFHIMPRLEHDGHYLWKGRPYGEGVMEHVAEKIKLSLKHKNMKT